MAFLRSAPLVRRLVAPASGRKVLSTTGGFLTLGLYELAVFHACIHVDM